MSTPIKMLLLFLFEICIASVVELNDENFDSLTKDKTWLVAFSASWCGKPCEELQPVLEEFSELYKGTIQVGNVSHKQDLVQRFEIQFYPAILLVGKGKYFHFVGTRNVSELTKFVGGDYRLSIPYDVPEKKVVELIHSLTSENFEKKVLNPRGAYWVVLFCDREDKNCFITKPAWKGLAQLEKGKFNFGEIDKQDSPDLFERFSIGTKIPSLYVFRAGNRYEYEGAYNFEDMQGFAEGGWNKSRPVKVQTKEEVQEQLGDVKILTDENFDLITKAMSVSSATPWLVEFYAPWCGHCKAIAPVWEQVATELRHRVNVAKLDCVANKNSSERFAIPGFPTLLLFKGGKFWQYDGSLRTKEVFVEWALKGYSEGKNKEGWAVPPPLGQPVPPPTWEDLIYTAKDDFTNFITYSPLPTFTLFGGGAFIGFCVSSYLLLLYSIIKLINGNSQPPKKENKLKKKK